MTEEEWISCHYSYDMLDHLGARASSRKLRLFACGCCRCVWRHLPDQSRAVVQLAELSCDGESTHKQVLAAIGLAPAGKKSGGAYRSYMCVQVRPYAQAERTVLTLEGSDTFEVAYAAARESMTLIRAEQCEIIRDLFGNPFCELPSYPSFERDSVRTLANQIYAESNFERLPELGSLLTHEGETDATLLDHCNNGSTHFRGCWPIDRILGYT